MYANMHDLRTCWYVYFAAMPCVIGNMPMMAGADNKHPDAHCARLQETLQHVAKDIVTSISTATAALQKQSCQGQTALLKKTLFMPAARMQRYLGSIS